MLKKYLEIYFKGQTNINILLWPDGDVCLQTFTSCFHRLLKWHQCVFRRQLSRKWSGSFVEVTTEHVQNCLFDSALFLKCLQQSYLNQKWPRFLLEIFVYKQWTWFVPHTVVLLENMIILPYSDDCISVVTNIFLYIGIYLPILNVKFLDF